MPTSARAVRTIFTEICGEFAGSLRADVGIGPYKVLCRILTAEYSGNEQNQDPLSTIRDCVWYICRNHKLLERYRPCARTGR